MFSSILEKTINLISSVTDIRGLRSVFVFVGDVDDGDDDGDSSSVLGLVSNIQPSALPCYMNGSLVCKTERKVLICFLSK